MQKQTRQTQTCLNNQDTAKQTVMQPNEVQPDEKETEQIHMQHTEKTGASLTDETSALSDLVVTNSQELMKGQSQIAIAHQGDTYFLRVTKQGKLILTK